MPEAWPIENRQLLRTIRSRLNELHASASALPFYGLDLGGALVQVTYASGGDLETAAYNQLPEGALVMVGDTVWARDNSATLIPRLPGLRPAGSVIDLRHFLAPTDGADASAEINAAFGALRTSLAQTRPPYMTLTGGGLKYRATSFIDASRLQTFRNISPQVRDFTLDCAMAGKNAIEWTGTPRVHLQDVHLVGAYGADEPRHGHVLARATPINTVGRHIDGWVVENCSVTGFFSGACVVLCAVEVITIDDMRCENSNLSGIGFADITKPSDLPMGIPVEGTAISITHQSNSVKSYNRLAIQAGTTYATPVITGWTATDPMTVTVSVPSDYPADFDLSTWVGAHVTIPTVTGIDHLAIEVLSVSGMTLTLDVDATAIDASGGGNLYRCHDREIIWLSSTVRTAFKDCYASNVGAPVFRWTRNTDWDTVNSIDLEFSLEGWALPYWATFDCAGGDFEIRSLRWRVPNTVPYLGIWNAINGTVVLRNLFFDMPNTLEPKATGFRLFVPAASFQFYDSHIRYPMPGHLSVPELGRFSGVAYCYHNDRNIRVDAYSQYEVCPFDYGATGDGVTDDTAAVAAAFAAFEARVDAGQQTTLTGRGGFFRCAAPIDLKGIRGLNTTGSYWQAQNLNLLVYGAGLVGMEILGSFNGKLSAINLEADPADPPAYGILSARRGSPPHPSNGVDWEDVTIRGPFTSGLELNIGISGSHRRNCGYHVTHPTAKAIILAGDPPADLVTSEAIDTTKTRTCSNLSYVGCIISHGGATGVITDVTAGAETVVTTSTDLTGDVLLGDEMAFVGLNGDTGAVELKEHDGVVTAITPTSVTLAIDTSGGLTPYVSDAFLVKTNDEPLVLMQRCSSILFRACQMINYGGSWVDIAWTDTASDYESEEVPVGTVFSNLTFEASFGGVAVDVGIRMLTNGSARQVSALNIASLGYTGRDSMIDADGTVDLLAPRVRVPDTSSAYGGVRYFAKTPANFNISGAHIEWIQQAGLDPTAFAGFEGYYYHFTPGNGYLRNVTVSP